MDRLFRESCLRCLEINCLLSLPVRAVLALFFFVGSLSGSWAAESGTAWEAAVVLGGGRVPVVVVSPGGTASEKFAAKELSSYLGSILQTSIQVLESDEVPAENYPIIVGHHPANAPLQPEKLELEESLIAVTPERIGIVGGARPATQTDKGELVVQDRGTLYGVYEFLDQLGVRWYRPEPWGEFVPKEQEISIPVGNNTAKPVYRYRSGMNSFRWWRDETPEQRRMARLWATRNRMNTNMYTPPEYGGYYQLHHDHSYQYLVPHEVYFKNHPEYFALIQGKRSDSPAAQLCLGNPEVQELVAQRVIESARKNPQMETISLEPNDGGLWCECELCKVMDDPALQSAAGGGVSKANRVSKFNNIIARKLNEALPGRKVAWLAYNQHTEVPTQVEKFEKNTLIIPAAYCAYSDYSRDLCDPQSAPNARFLKILQGYGGRTEIMTYEYWTCYAWAGPMPMLRVMTDRLRQYNKNFNVQGVYNETHPCWGPQGINLYFLPRLLWNPYIDVEKEAALYYRNYYGPAAEPMRQYHESLEAAAKDGPYFMSGGYQIDRLFTPELLEKLKKSLDEAAVLVRGKQPYEKRLAGVVAGFEYAERIAKITKLKGEGKLTEALSEQRDLEKFFLSFHEGDVFDNGPSFYSSFFKNWMEEYVKDIQAKENLLRHFENPRVVQAHDKKWKFQIDPEDEGVRQGWFKADADLTGWAVLDGGRAWQEQGYPDHHGVAWYRRLFHPPQVEGGQRVILYFGAVDGDATVYINGKVVGEHKLAPDLGGWNEPFFFDITDHLIAGRENLMAVRVRKDKYVGGISREVQLLAVDKVLELAKK